MDTDIYQHIRFFKRARFVCMKMNTQYPKTDTKDVYWRRTDIGSIAWALDQLCDNKSPE